MLDFLVIKTSNSKRGVIEIRPHFRICKSKDLMIRGRDFYAVWNEEKGVWSTDEQDVITMIDHELNKFAEEHRSGFGFDAEVIIKYMWDASSHVIDEWHTYCQRQMRDNYEHLDGQLVFTNDPVDKTNYSSKHLPYALEKGTIQAYDELMSVLYAPEERHKLEWAIGSVVTGASKDIQKFIVLYGDPGTGKSTVLDIIQDLFEGYYCVFDAKALGNPSNVFALEPFRNNPLVAIQQDGDLSNIEDNTRLNSLVSHDYMSVNEKYKSTYTNRFDAFLFLGTNKPVRITDSKSGLLRRLIDVSPTGEKINYRHYKKLVKDIRYELGAIAYHCKTVYEKDPNRYDDYVPTGMMAASNDFYNYIVDNYFYFSEHDEVSLKQAWNMYKQYCEDANVKYPHSQRLFKEELKSYFREYHERVRGNDGNLQTFYSKFRKNKVISEPKETRSEVEESEYIIEFRDDVKSAFDVVAADYPAQYASGEAPGTSWDKNNRKLSELDTSLLHYVLVPIYHIVIDFDLCDENGNKCFEKNLAAASKWPKTYAELSKSGKGIHLHYYYTGDPLLLCREFDEHIEVKVFNGLSSLRRKLTKCNDLPIATISSGLKLREEKKVVDDGQFTNEKKLRCIIEKALRKEYGATKPSIDFIAKLLNDAKDSGQPYDVSDLYSSIIGFAMNSTHHKTECVRLVNSLPFASVDKTFTYVSKEDLPIAFIDVEVFPNLFVVCYKVIGKEYPVIRLINPTAETVREILDNYNLIGFNNRKYDNHILYAASLGYSNAMLYQLSFRLINNDKDALFGAAYNISYTDIYDFSSASNKKSLKKWEIELGIHHHELGLPWDQPVPEDLFETVAEYCSDDVIATEAVFNHLQSDWIARQILADLADGTVNDTTNTLTTKLIFGDAKNPQSTFNYRDLSKPVGADQYDFYKETFPEGHVFRVFDSEGQPLYQDYDPNIPLPDGYSILPFFPGYQYSYGVSTYKDICADNPDPDNRSIGEGGCVWSLPGMYTLIALLDIASQHPHSILAEWLFGPYTQKFCDLVNARIYIKHGEFDKAKLLFDGKLAKYLDDGRFTPKELSNALKTAINSVYGLTSARFPNPFRDPRNVDNIVAKRGALFMINLRHEVTKRGFTVAHIKTDSIKIPNATPEIIQFVMEYGREFGYEFEHEETYGKMCLVNRSVYIARYDKPHINKETGAEEWWTATGKQFAVPYVFKTLFSHENIEFEDLCETFSVKEGDLYLDFNENLPDISGFEKEIEKADRYRKAGKITEDQYTAIVDPLREKIKAGHALSFVGRVGSFCPIQPGCGGGELYRVKDDHLYAASGTTGFRWIESEYVKGTEKEACIDRRYYNKLVDGAVDTMAAFGNVEWFVSDDTGPMPMLGQPNDVQFGTYQPKPDEYMIPFN